ncbi:unnamed protein product [Sphagnum jensenii]|uniref:Uncharacterized protein n=1 Tax=Sphagnum jensenii TaxID=128206 RepID=A0ABP1B8N4_9BRYO
MAQCLQILQLEADINASCPALGFEAPSAFGRGRVPGFSIVPTALKPSDAAGNPNKPNILAYNLLLHAKLHLGAHADDTLADATDANCGRAGVCCSGGDFETAVNTVHDMELAFSSLQDSKGLEILSPCSSLWPLVLAIAQAGPGALDVAYYKLAEIHGSGRAVSLAAIKCAPGLCKYLGC